MKIFFRLQIHNKKQSNKIQLTLYFYEMKNKSEQNDEKTKKQRQNYTIEKRAMIDRKEQKKKKKSVMII